MRNLLQYPITTDEICDHLCRLLQLYMNSEEPQAIGDIKGACLQEAIARVQAVPTLEREIIQCAVELEEAAKLLKHAANLPGVAGIYERAAARARQTLGEQ